MYHALDFQQDKCLMEIQKLQECCFDLFSRDEESVCCSRRQRIQWERAKRLSGTSGAAAKSSDKNKQ